MPAIWAGVDAGKTHHHCTVIDSDGQRLLSRKTANDEAELIDLIAEVNALDTDVLWAVDLNSGGAALLITLLLDHGQELIYIPGRTVHHASGSYRGDGKTDAKDAFVIADQARMRRDLQPLAAFDEIAADLRIYTARRTDLGADRTRAINRMRDQLLGYFPALERAFDYSKSKAALVLLGGDQTPAALRRMGQARLESWLRARKVRNAARVARAAITAAQAQRTTVRGEKAAASMVAKLAGEVIALDAEIAETDAAIEGRFREHEHAGVITSLPGVGTLLGAEFIAATGGDMAAFASADRLAGVAGLAPVPKDSGRISGNLHRPRRYSRRLMRVFYMSALLSIRCCPASQAFYERKRAEGKRHAQAVIALARRRVNVLWAMLRDGRPYSAAPPVKLAAAA
ncbi:IS110 family RNA-guided transposase [Streptomonospora litoralis]|uniref:Transposase IS116/IS110/IS902 family protein n=1 Tax=Streptomonospora litoralis TaxID=2498135 RepID=A0A4P6Q1I6_9ACTN|nr:IS110 family transposase [Streptomonospora litoralis]QBI54353.1 Transposase IS116/IS110/IS902 family protein [Streptomonospora litoralis]